MPKLAPCVTWNAASDRAPPLPLRGEGMGVGGTGPKYSAPRRVRYAHHVAAPSLGRAHQWRSEALYGATHRSSARSITLPGG